MSECKYDKPEWLVEIHEPSDIKYMMDYHRKEYHSGVDVEYNKQKFDQCKKALAIIKGELT